jgi:phosphoadenosine phosphosulfate reductase
MAKTLDIDVSELSSRLEPLSTTERVRHAYDIFGEDLILSTSFGPTAGTMLKIATDVYPGIRVITVRHGYESPLTLQIADRLTRELGLNLRIFSAPKMLIPEEGTQEFDEFRRKIKIEPFQKALSQEQPRAWLTGVMRDETEERKSFDFATFRDGLTVVYPILDWTHDSAADYCYDNCMPVNRTYFDPTKGLNQAKECGLHLGDIGNSWTASGL